MTFRMFKIRTFFIWNYITLGTFVIKRFQNVFCHFETFLYVVYTERYKFTHPIGCIHDSFTYPILKFNIHLLLLQKLIIFVSNQVNIF